MDDHAAAIHAAQLQRRLDAIRAHKPRHGIVPLDGRCAVCDVEIYESADYRGARYRHEYPTDG